MKMPTSVQKSGTISDRITTVQRRLDNFVFNRVMTTSISSLTAVACYIWVLFDRHLMTDQTLAAGLASILLNIPRILIVRAAQHANPQLKHNRLKDAYHFLSAAVNMAWMLVVADVYLRLGSAHPATFFAMLITCGLMAGIPNSVGPMLRLAFTNAGILGLGAICIVLYNASTPQDYMMASLCLVFTALIGKHSFDFHRTLTASYVASNNAEAEMRSVKALLNSVPGYMTLLDTDLRYIMVNDAFSASMNQNVIGSRVGHMAEEAEFTAMVEQFVESGAERKTTELKLGPSFKQEHFLVSLARIHNPFEGVAILTMNIEDRILMEQELAQTRQEMEHASRLVTLGEMISSVSHEIRNPLTIIAGKASYFKIHAARGTLTTEATNNEADVILKMVDRIAKIIQTTLRFSHGDMEMKMADTPLKQILDDATYLASSRLKSEFVELRGMNTLPDVSIECQPLQISQVIVNLITNAIDAMEGQETKWIQIAVVDLGEKIQVKVTDGGPGIPEDLREKIMQPFFTTKPIGKGTGLGLSISRNILQNHQGGMTLDVNAPHTTFVLELWKKLPGSTRGAA